MHARSNCHQCDAWEQLSPFLAFFHLDSRYRVLRAHSKPPVRTPNIRTIPRMHLIDCLPGYYHLIARGNRSLQFYLICDYIRYEFSYVATLPACHSIHGGNYWLSHMRRILSLF